MKKILIIIIPALLFYGCGVWTNLTTYFNLYYNSSDLFEKAEKDIKDANKDIFSTEPVPLPSGASANINKVIEKCSQILQFHSKSSYVDDALLMIGKCFYYQTYYQKALRKFNELLATQPNSDLILEANLWIGMSQMGMRDYDNATNTLQNVMDIAQKDGKRSILEQAYIEEIKYKISQQDNDGAITLLENFLKTSDNNEFNAEAAFKLGMLYKENGDNPDAIKSFDRVNNYSPTYFVLVNSLIEQGKTLRENQEYEKSLDLFNSMRSQEKYSDAFDQIEVQTGITYVRMNRIDDALQKFTLVDTTYSKTPSAGLAEYEMASIFENSYQNFDSADFYYKKSLSHSLPTEYIKEVRDKEELISKYKINTSNLNRIKKDILYIQHPEEFVKDSLAFEQKISEQKEKLLQEEEKNKNRPTTNRFTQNLQRNIQPTINLQPPKRPTASLDSLTNELVKNKFELGNILFTEFNLPDSAIKYYKDIINNYPETDLKAKVLYAIGSYYLVKNDSVRADSLFNIIYNDYRNESIVNAAANKLNKPLVQFNYDSVESLYTFAENQLDKNKYDSSLVNFYNIYLNHPSSVYAAKALYSYGWILENKLNLTDSAAAIYDTLSKKYPNTIYYNAVKNKLSYYLFAKQRAAKLRADSLNGNIAQDTSSVKSQPGSVVSNEQKINGEKKTDVNQLSDKQIEDRKKEVISDKNTVSNPDTLIRVLRRFNRK